MLLGSILAMSSDSTGEKIKDKVMETKDKVKETIGMGENDKGPSSDSPTKKVEGPGKALGKEEGSE
jgi:hypothetical protein